MKTNVVNTLANALNNVMEETISNFNTAKRSLRYSVEKALMELMNANETDVIELDDYYSVAIGGNDGWAEITAIRKITDEEEGETYLSYELTIELEDGSKKTALKRFFSVPSTIHIDIWESVMELYGITED